MGESSRSKPAALAGLSLALLDVYKRRISPRLGDRCRYEISCSTFMRQSIIKYGFLSGVCRGLRRLSSCGPWSRRPYSDSP
ncbi:MAG: membrane protein insertion efficiency factor YidD [Phycisphaerales bacterium]|nr:membrane protein insertion efficiency factor YidD [Phycisphaerales bacterium]